MELHEMPQYEHEARVAMLWRVVGNGDHLPRHGGGAEVTGCAESARTTIGAVADGATGLHAPPMVGGVHVATSIEAIGNYATGLYAAVLGPFSMIDGPVPWCRQCTMSNVQWLEPRTDNWA